MFLNPFDLSFAKRPCLLLIILIQRASSALILIEAATGVRIGGRTSAAADVAGGIIFTALTSSCSEFGLVANCLVIRGKAIKQSHEDYKHEYAVSLGPLMEHGYLFGIVRDAFWGAVDGIRLDARVMGPQPMCFLASCT